MMDGVNPSPDGAAYPGDSTEPGKGQMPDNVMPNGDTVVERKGTKDSTLGDMKTGKVDSSTLKEDTTYHKFIVQFPAPGRYNVHLSCTMDDDNSY